MMLTPRQTDCLDFIASWSQLKGIPPSRIEIGKALKICSSRAQELVQALVRDGYIEIEYATARAIRLTCKARPQNRGATIEVPVISSGGGVPRFR